LALPNASRSGFEAKTYYSMVALFVFAPNYSAAKYFRIILVDSVFPDPLSPLIIIEQILNVLEVSSNN
jgi:hypothetical protein